MKLTVNDKTVNIFEGAVARDAVRRYMSMCGRNMHTDIDNDVEVCDRYGHEIGLDAPLKDGLYIEVKQLKNEER